MKKLKSKLNQLEKLEYELQNFNYNKLKRIKVRITKKYANWYKDNIDSLHSTVDGIKKNRDYFNSEKIYKKRPVGKIISAGYDHEEGITIRVDYGFSKEYYDLKDVVLVK